MLMVIGKVDRLRETIVNAIDGSRRPYMGFIPYSTLKCKMAVRPAISLRIIGGYHCTFLQNECLRGMVARNSLDWDDISRILRIWMLYPDEANDEERCDRPDFGPLVRTESGRKLSDAQSAKSSVPQPRRHRAHLPTIDS